MKKIVACILIVVLVVGIMFAFVPRQDAAADTPDPTCTVQVLNIVCVQAGVQVLNQPITIPTVRVTLPPITVPGPTRTATVTIRPNPVRETQTVTAPAAPVPTRTIQVPGPTTTRTLKPTAGPTEAPAPTQTVTIPGLNSVTTVTPSPRQPQGASGTLDPGGDGLLPRNQPPVIVAGIGVGILLAVAALILLGMYGGYYIGYKDSDKADANFFRSLLNKE